MKNVIISIGTENFYYWNISLLEKLRYLRDISGISGIEIACVEPGRRFLEDEILLLSCYSYNTMHLWGFEKKDKEWLDYCRKTIPNFRHFVLHPDSANLDDIDAELEEYISFENMDPRKASYKTPEEMKRLFERFPKAKFTFDINHSDENNIPRNEFQVIQKPIQIHFSAVNKSCYPEYPDIQSTHSLAYMDSDFNTKMEVELMEDVIITFEWVFPPNNRKYIENEIAFAKTILDHQ